MGFIKLNNYKINQTLGDHAIPTSTASSSTSRRHSNKGNKSNKSSNTTKLTHSTNKRFLKNKSSINSALCEHIASRRINVQVADLCSAANITTSTFYAHYKDSNHALAVLEDDLATEFRLRLPQNTTRTTFFDLLTIFIIHNYQYFEAACTSSNHYLLTRIFTDHRQLLVGDHVSNRSFLSYTGSLIMIITCWLIFDQLTTTSTITCSKKLAHVPIITDERWL